MQIRWQIRDLPANRDRVFEMWLVDPHSKRSMSLGAFSTQNGYAEVVQSIGLVNPEIFDEAWVTSEKINDLNPNPDQIALRGKLV